jgi:hypothetical protein
MKLITLNLLSKAIVHKLRYTTQQARRTAEFLLDIFGYDDRIIDNVLDPEDRQLFYLLQSVGILSNGRDETILYDGREWRTHYWQLERENITNFAHQPISRQFPINPPEVKRRESPYETVYYALADDVWSSRKIDNQKPSVVA